MPGQDIRSRFPVFENVAYVNSCSQGALSDSVREAYSEYLRGLEFQGSLWEEWIERLERVRSLLAEVLNVSSSEVAVTASASAGVAALAGALDFSGKRNKIVTTDLEFPTIGQIWHAQECRGAQVLHVEADKANTIPLERFAAVIDDTTRIVSVAHVCYRNGAMIDLEPIVDLAHSRGATVLIDAYQSVGAIPFDAARLGADFVTGGCLKYLLGSPGVGYLYARSDTTGGVVPASTGWLAARDISAMDIYSYDPAADARRFEAGTPAVPALYAAAAGVELMLEIGIDRTRHHVEGLIRQLRSGVESIGGIVVTPERSRGPMLAVAATDEIAYVDALAKAGVVVSSRGGNVRISPHCYNTDSDIEAVVAALHAHRHFLR